MAKRVAIFSALFALTFAGGCGASGGDGSTADPATTTTAASGATTASSASPQSTTTDSSSGNGDTVAVRAWADDFCGSFSSWTDDIGTLSDDVTNQVPPGDVEGAQTVLVDFFDDVSQRTKTLIDDLDAAGIPDIEDGDQLVEDLKGKFQEFDDAIASTRSDLDGVDTNDAQAFQDQVKSSLNDFQTEATDVGDSFSELDAKYPSRELDSAINSSCDF